MKIQHVYKVKKKIKKVQDKSFKIKLVGALLFHKLKKMHFTTNP